MEGKRWVEYGSKLKGLLEGGVVEKVDDVVEL